MNVGMDHLLTKIGFILPQHIDRANRRATFLMANRLASLRPFKQSAAIKRLSSTLQSRVLPQR
jgi:hypothetical protein